MEKRVITLQLDPKDKKDAELLKYLDSDLPRGYRERATKQALLKYSRSRKRNNPL